MRGSSLSRVRRAEHTSADEMSVTETLTERAPYTGGAALWVRCECCRCCAAGLAAQQRQQHQMMHPIMVSARIMQIIATTILNQLSSVMLSSSDSLELVETVTVVLVTLLPLYPVPAR